MTVSAKGVRAVYLGSGSVGPFNLVDNASQPILFSLNSDLVVRRYDTTLAGTVLTLTTDYTLTGADDDEAGTITLTSELTSGYILTVERETPLTQLINLEFGGPLSLESIEQGLDKLTRIVQDHDQRLDRAVLFQPFFTGNAYYFDEPESGGILSWDITNRRIVSTEQVDSAVILSGSGVPSSGLGDDGDFYIDYTNSRVYGPKTAGSWGSGTSLIGPAGATGPTGPAGPQGEPGAPGSGSGDVVGPSSVTDNRVVAFSGTTGKLIKEATFTAAQLATLLAVAYTSGGTDVALADGGTGASLSDPGGDRIMFWDDSATSTAYLNMTSGLTITGTTLSMRLVTGVDHTPLTDPNIDRLVFWDDSAGTVTFLTASTGLTISGTDLLMTQGQREAGIPFLIDGGGTTITAGVKGYFSLPFTGIITQYDLLPDQSGSIKLDLWKDTYANYPPTNADSITGTAEPTITTNTKAQDSTLTGWTSTFTKGDIIGVNVDHCTTITRATLMLYVRKTG